MIKSTFLKNYFKVSVENRLEQMTLEKEEKDVRDDCSVSEKI